MVAKDHGVVFCRVHQSNDIRALAQRGQGTALSRISGVYQQGIFSFFAGLPNTGGLVRPNGAGAAADQRAVHVVGVENCQVFRRVFRRGNNRFCIRRGRRCVFFQGFCPFLSRSSGFCHLSKSRRYGHRSDNKHQRQRKGCDTLAQTMSFPLKHFSSPLCFYRCLILLYSGALLFSRKCCTSFRFLKTPSAPS